ncbi:MAG: hypothetical protein EA394_09115 [Bacteroidia bacterium]|nr:MAG: hypothetical protein EA394_09115 [Bacteroidia bacterium]
MLNKDDWALGIIIGILLPCVVYGLVILIMIPYGHVENLVYMPRPQIPFLVAIFSNLFSIRYYMVTKKFDRTGRGILLITFGMAILFFIFLM